MAGGKQILIPGILVLLALVLTYSNHFNNPFQFDDAHTIETNMAIRKLDVARFFTDATTFSTLPANQSYRPGVTTLNAIDHWLGGKEVPDPFYYHLSIFTSFVLLAFLVYLLALHLFNSARPHEWNPYLALFAAAFFGLHTANAETVNYIIARTDSFSTFMVVLALVTYIYKPAWRRWFIYLIPVVIGFTAKEPAVMFAPLLFFYILLFEQETSITGSFTAQRKNLGKAIRASLPAFILSGLLYLVSKKMTPETWLAGGESLPYYLSQPFVIVHYFNNFILPVNLSADTDWTGIERIWDDRVLVGTGFIILLFAISIYTSRFRHLRPIAFGILWFFTALLPTSIVPLAEVMNDHRTFFPYIGLFIAAAWSLGLLVIKYDNRIASQSRVGFTAIAFAVILLGAHAFGTHKRNEVWSSAESLWKDVTVKSPGNARGWMNYGNALMGRAEFNSALECYNKALTIWPAYSYLHINLGILKGAMGMPDDAEQHFRNALDYGPGNPEGYYYYARWLNETGRVNEAQDILARGLVISPQHVSMNQLYAQVQLTANSAGSKLDQAIIAASQNPTQENYLNLSLEFYLAGKYEKSIEAAQEALKINPSYADAYNNIGAAHAQLKQWNESIAACEKALELKPDFQLAKNNLEWAKSQVK